jgi:glycosyltransferase involved in cell wall biosynthesis
MSAKRPVAVWFPAVRTGTGTDVFTERLVAGLTDRGIRAEITWLPLRAEYAPWTVPIPRPPAWASVTHVNSWLHPRFLPTHMPIVVTLHHSMHDPALYPYKGAARAAYHRWWMAPFERRVLRRADRVVAVSQFVADTARRALLDWPMDVVYNGVDNGRFRPGKRIRRPGEPFSLLYVGGWKRLKGVDLLAPIMRELGNDFVLNYTGGAAATRDRASLPANMRDLGRLTVDGVVLAMQNADAFLFPSRSEGLPLVAIEAMACGLPVVATRGSSLVEAVQDGVAGILCREGDVSAFSNALRHMAQDQDAHKRMRSSARESAVSKFSIDDMVEKYVECYVSVACMLGRRR